ncbi:hypothetical protein [Bacillus cereus]|uniref:hypothetical protein n=1 Tax=Bacillus cereus group TaxID=86661 RepID=UPI000319ABE4|nr:hypothetical protein [Bacillus cereus]
MVCPIANPTTCCQVMIEHKTDLVPPALENTVVVTQTVEADIENVIPEKVVVCGVVHKTLTYTAVLEDGTQVPNFQIFDDIPFQCAINREDANEGDFFEVTGAIILGEVTLQEQNFGFINDSRVAFNFKEKEIIKVCIKKIIDSSEFCIPTVEGSKPKTSPEEKINTIIKNNQVPSVLASSFFQMARRYLKGLKPVDSIETAAFNVFRNLSPAVRNVLSCSVRRVDALPKEIRNQLLSPDFSRNEPVIPDKLAQLLSKELLQRASLVTFGDSEGLINERPGRPRIIRGPDNEPFVPPSICIVNEYRTNSFSVDPNFFRPDEFQQVCRIDSNNQTVCEIQPPPCPGNSIIPGLGQPPICLRVPDVSPGTAVKLQGVNFIDVNGQVRITSKSGAVAPRLVDAHVWGDVTTPVTEIVDGQVRIINDCRVKDVITFKVPEDLIPGIYSIEVIIQNNTGVGLPGQQVSEKQYINILPPPTATFQVSSVRLDIPEETSGPGSDEVGIRVLSIPISNDLTPGEIITNNFRFNGVDSGESRDMTRNLIQGSNLAGISLAIVGYEIDSDDAYEAQIQEFADAFEQVIKSSWKIVADAVGAVAGLAAGALLTATWGSVIGSAISLAILIFAALWAPADLIIEDFIGLSTLDLAAMTSANFPIQPNRQFTSPGGIDVSIGTVSKNATQTVEKRDYHSDEEDSRYQITLRYIRLI